MMSQWPTESAEPSRPPGARSEGPSRGLATRRGATAALRRVGIGPVHAGDHPRRGERRAVAGRTHHDGGTSGRFAAQFALTPSLSGGTDVQIPPLGSLDLGPVHDGAAHLDRAAGLAGPEADPRAGHRPERDRRKATPGLRSPTSQRGVNRLAFQSTGAAMLGALVLSGLVYRNMRRMAICGGAGASSRSWSSGGISPRLTFRGRLGRGAPVPGACCPNAPAVIGDAAADRQPVRPVPGRAAAAGQQRRQAPTVTVVPAAGVRADPGHAAGTARLRPATSTRPPGRSSRPW